MEFAPAPVEHGTAAIRLLGEPDKPTPKGDCNRLCPVAGAKLIQAAGYMVSRDLGADE